MHFVCKAMHLRDNVRVIPWIELTFEFHLFVKLKLVFEKVLDSGHVRLDKEHPNGQPALAGVCPSTDQYLYCCV